MLRMTTALMLGVAMTGSAFAEDVAPRNWSTA